MIGKHSLTGTGTRIPAGKTIPGGVLVLAAPGKLMRDLYQIDMDKSNNGSGLFLFQIATPQQRGALSK